MCCIEETLEHKGKMPTYYRRYVDHMLTIMPNKTSANVFLETLNHRHSSIKFTMEMENNGMLLFLGKEQLNKSTYTGTKVYVKPTNTGLLLHHKSRVDDRYKRSLVKIMLSSSWSYNSKEYDRLKLFFSQLKFPDKVINSTITHFIVVKASDQPVSSLAKPDAVDPICIVLPFKDQASADTSQGQLKDLSQKIHVSIQPVFVSHNIQQDLKSHCL